MAPEKNFQKLTPIRNADLRIYEEAFDFVFSENDLKNIAITGPYSAGKSSVIETYKAKQTKKKFLTISLAHFQSVESKQDESDTPKDKQILDSTLEGKILNQLIHQIDPASIPHTNFKVKRTISNFKMFTTAILFVICFLFTLYLFKFSSWKKIIQNSSNTWLKQTLAFTTNEIIVFIVGVLCAVALVFITDKIIKMVKYNKLMFKKFKVQGSEIELFEDAKESYFDKYLNEVLYLFENARADVIVFEDMDRFNNNQIFEKLREINWLINNKSKKNIRFFYLLRDDTFISKDRTKFFDFIIPIVPIVDGSNSYDQFISHFMSSGILNKFDEHFLQGLSLYIDDMRILKNIYNEYVIYHDRIQSTELNNDKLLAIITYKNIFPRDFSELQLGRGYVYNLFLNKDKFITKKLSQMENKIQVMEKELQTIEIEMCNDLDELDAIYLVTGVHFLDVNNSREDAFISRVAFVKAMKNYPDNVYHQNRHGRVQYNFQEVYNRLMNNPEYVERKRFIEKKATNSVQVIQNEILRDRNEMSQIINRKLHELITKENIGEIFEITFSYEIGDINSYKDVKIDPYFPLIKYLIRKGYIDESYPDYMTYFYENSISRIDKIFLRSVTDELAKDYTYELNDPTLIIKRLIETDFDKEETLNFNLFRHLLKSRHSYLNRFIEQLKNKRRFDFIAQFYGRGEETPEFIKTINQAWPNVFKGVVESGQFSDSLIHQYIIDSLNYSSAETIVSLNSDDFLSMYISNKKDFLNIDTPDISLIIEKLCILNVKFEHIDYEKANKALFNEVYKSDLYQINNYMISLILEQKYKLPYTEEYRHKNYTLVLSKSHENLLIYLRKNINKYLEIILEECGSKVEDDEEAAIELINNLEIRDVNKLMYINYLAIQLKYLDRVTDMELWPIIFNQQKVQYSVHNILQYYFNYSNDLDEHLLNFVNSSLANLIIDIDEISVNFGSEETVFFFEKIIKCNDLSDDRYDTFIQGLNWEYTEFTFREVSGSKIRILISRDIIKMNNYNLQFMRENYPNELLFFMKKNIEVYATEVISEDNFLKSELMVILEQDDIPDSPKIKLLGYTSDPITVTNNKYSESIILHILEHNLQIDDLPYLFTDYDRMSNLKSKISLVSKQNIELIINREYKVPFSLLCDLLDSDQILAEYKDDILVMNLLELDLVQTMTCLNLLDKSDILSLFSGKRPKVEKTYHNEKILNIFESKNWIYGFDTEKSEPEFYRARGRRIS
ncbi:hypothetical protein FE784_23955 [Paenibacillus hemerocallicola]|uniref:YobI-like P-loop NTPase domain-containing protein n=1 Tax=Paenibacillus hemerocallicola TaxID=1172614 RepID=A0A5C4T622_9BACL|nr:hypothetical protein [Paenibacillus hemerocallicola]TNJ63777.1 hypothetical protein FE784_23955 [Paenibacillus hemerocallicola]